MNIEDALRVAKIEVGFDEIPLNPEERGKLTRRVFQLCNGTNRKPTKLEEFS